MPHVTECAQLFPVPTGAPGAFTATQIETYTRHDGADNHGFAAPSNPHSSAPTGNPT